MKKLIYSLAFFALVSQLQATDLRDVVRTIASDLNIHVVHGNSRHVEYRHARNNAHKVHKKKHVSRTKRKTVVSHKKRRASHVKPRKLNFHSLSEYRHVSRPKAKSKRDIRHHTRKKKVAHSKAHPRGKKLGKYVGNGWYSDDDGYYNEEWEDTYSNQNRWRHHSRHTQRAYRHYRRYWYLTFLYEGSSFYDKHGFCYGEFDRRGFTFDGLYYRYDDAYTYQDRLHGKGLFEHRYYRPIRSTASNSINWDDNMFPFDGEGFIGFQISLN